MDKVEMSQTPMRTTSNGWIIITVAILFFLSTVVLALAAYFIFYRPQVVIPAVSTTDQGAMMARLGTLVDLPQDEKPQIVTVTDVDSLKTQTFFTRAESGNILILYIRNHLAILYDQKENKIVNLSKITAVVIPPPAL